MEIPKLLVLTSDQTQIYTFCVDKPPLYTGIIPVVRPWLEPSQNLIRTLQTLLQSGHVTNNGIKVKEFESAIADFLHVERVVAVSSGSDALLLSLLAMGVKGKAILPAFTYISTLNAVENAGLEPVFCDIDPNTWTMSPNHLKTLLNSHHDCSVILPVNVYGVHPEMDKISMLARQCGAKVLYDNAHGFGSLYRGQTLPDNTDAVTFSFHATKILPAVEGGAVYSGNQELLDRVSILRNHGLTADQLDSFTGYNAKLDELRAAVGLESLDRIKIVLENRRDYAARLRKHIMSCCPREFRVQTVPDDQESNFQNLVVMASTADDSAQLVPLFKQAGIEVRPYFRPALHRLKRFGTTVKLPVTDYVADRILALPMHSFMNRNTLETIEKAVDAVARGERQWT